MVACNVSVVLGAAKEDSCATSEGLDYPGSVCQTETTQIMDASETLQV